MRWRPSQLQNAQQRTLVNVLQCTNLQCGIYTAAIVPFFFSEAAVETCPSRGQPLAPELGERVHDAQQVHRVRLLLARNDPAASAAQDVVVHLCFGADEEQRGRHRTVTEASIIIINMVGRYGSSAAAEQGH